MMRIPNFSCVADLIVILILAAKLQTGPGREMSHIYKQTISFLKKEGRVHLSEWIWMSHFSGVTFGRVRTGARSKSSSLSLAIRGFQNVGDFLNQSQFSITKFKTHLNFTIYNETYIKDYPKCARTES